jgi:hypothetical protein
METLDTTGNFVESWADLVTEYSKCELTYEMDKLVAIAGIAAEWRNYVREEKRDIYQSGLFDCCLPQGLLWYSGTGPLKRIKKRAPSWSWASVDGHVQFMNTANTCAVASAHMSRKASDESLIMYNHDCQLLMHASVKEAAFVTGQPVDFGTESIPELIFHRSRGAIIKGVHLNMEGKQDWGKASIDIGDIERSRPVFCARLLTQQFGKLQIDYVLLLRRIGKLSKLYKRIGVGVVFGKGLFDDSPPRDISII